VAAVGVINSSHPGMMASYVLRTVERGFLAFAFTNTGPKILSHHGKRPYFGTNPIAFACPREEKAPFCLDMATRVIPWNKVEAARKSNTPLPEDAERIPTTAPNEAASLLASGSYKGYGLAAMVEILCTVLLGMAFGHHTVQIYGPNSPAWPLLPHPWCESLGLLKKHCEDQNILNNHDWFIYSSRGVSSEDSRERHSSVV